jgi:hypothetical protein
MDDNPFPPVFASAVEAFRNWSHQQLSTQQAATKITEPLYHYTDAAGLCGIVKSQKIRFTSCLHLNDPSELIHGMDIVHRLLKAIGERARDDLVKESSSMTCFNTGNLRISSASTSLASAVIAMTSVNGASMPTRAVVSPLV